MNHIRTHRPVFLAAFLMLAMGSGPAALMAENTCFRRGDANTDGAVDVSDTVTTLRFLFVGDRDLNCQDAADANDDGLLDVADPIVVFRFLFLEGDELSDLPAPVRDKLGLLGLLEMPSRADVIEALATYDAAAFLQGLVMVEPVKNSRIAMVSIELKNSERAARIANAFVDAYIEYNIDQKVEFTRSAADWLSGQAAELRPPSSFTACAPPSFTKRIALRTASSGETWYEPKGMSPTTRARRTPRATSRVW